MKSTNRREGSLASRGVLASWVAWSLGITLVVGGADARADLYRCRKNGDEKITNYKERGWRCIRLDIDTDPPPAPKAEDTGYTPPPVTAPAPRVAAAPRAFEAPRPKTERFAPLPPVTQRFDGNEPDDREGREKIYAAYFAEAADLYDLPEAFLLAVARVESNFRYRAKSSAGAMGLMQLMPGTAKAMGVGDVWDPRSNVLGGARFLRHLADRFKGDMVKVLAGYHAGGGAVAAADGVPYEATESYVRSVLDYYYQYRSLAGR
ncbi:MAG: transglycosylase SLT domain-containing protein [Deltaproteobacteria bacterium]|nr:transglycosylase SLT domain-containing protein [Deltaproteobacteria bacterium]